LLFGSEIRAVHAENASMLMAGFGPVEIPRVRRESHRGRSEIPPL
jgi:hypothetical protein